ncbi:uncharacterized protein N7459_007985 [Penicillium hispanicum]|uniref:uncharacterized protein n=1 Tax=Penicillium hispanicum TaxID=1080232 RepID=UPI00253FC3FE|nr:uncharacterized protein N7459_007985 [Penicillium hispanicum]KAJ5573558.1 hypothetical protein N7459_007985 [Penicillium hispanicum]
MPTTRQTLRRTSAERPGGESRKYETDNSRDPDFEPSTPESSEDDSSDSSDSSVSPISSAEETLQVPRSLDGLNNASSRARPPSGSASRAGKLGRYTANDDSLLKSPPADDATPGPSSPKPRKKRATRRANFLQKAYAENALRKLNESQMAAEKENFENKKLIIQLREKDAESDRMIEYHETRNHDLESENHQLRQELTDNQKYNQKNTYEMAQMKRKCEGLEEENRRILSKADKARRSYMTDNKVAAIGTTELVQSLLHSVEEMRKVKRLMESSVDEWHLVEQRAGLNQRQHNERVKDIKRCIDSVIEMASLPPGLIMNLVRDSGVAEIERVLQLCSVDPKVNEKRARRQERERRKMEVRRGKMPVNAAVNYPVNRKKVDFAEYKRFIDSSTDSEFSSSSWSTKMRSIDSSSLAEDSANDSDTSMESAPAASTAPPPNAPIFRPPRLRLPTLQHQPDSLDIVMGESPRDPVSSLAEEVAAIDLAEEPMEDVVIGCALYHSTSPLPVDMDLDLTAPCCPPSYPPRKRRRATDSNGYNAPDARYSTEINLAKRTKIYHSQPRINRAAHIRPVSMRVSLRRLVPQTASSFRPAALMPIKPIEPALAAPTTMSTEPQQTIAAPKRSIIGQHLGDQPFENNALAAVLAAGIVPMYLPNMPVKNNTAYHDKHSLIQEVPASPPAPTMQRSLSLGPQSDRIALSMPGMWPETIPDIDNNNSFERVLQQCTHRLLRLLHERPRTVLLALFSLVAAMIWLWQQLEQRGGVDWEAANTLPGNMLSQPRSTRAAEMRWVSEINFELVRWLDYDRAQLG